ncbi:MAG: carboxy terminal-processing peptidase [Bacteroidetes bacterium]|nr:carboxy terminal-processing peptidase [Bacteroidota bacterium]
MNISKSTFSQSFDRMSKTGYFLLSVFLVGLIVFASYHWYFKPTQEKDQLLLSMLTDGMKTQHFAPHELNDSYSEKVFNTYIERLDINKKFFLQKDIESLNRFKTNIDDEINAGTTNFFEAANAIYETRTKQAANYYKPILTEAFDFNVDEYYENDSKKTSFAADSNALKEQWRKYLKYQTLIRLNDLIEEQDKARERKDTSFTEKSLTELEKTAREKVKKSNDDGFKRLFEIDKDDRYNLFLNTLVNVHDPHTEYFPPADKQNFDIAMSGQLQGIGAQLQEKDGFIKVNSIIPGGPAYRDARLKAGDLILKVAQDGQEPVEVTEMRLDKAVQLIRGKKGTKVTLTIKKPDGAIDNITLTRDIVIIEETYAQSAIINGKEKIGYIRLTGFYSDFGKGGRDCADDVKNELIKLKKENIDGVVLDLRDNGGGSLESVVRMVGLFIRVGPVVQVKSKNEDPGMMSDFDASVTYDGPLVVMVNENSASASEILAAAIQDYKRGIIIGSPTTFGKGTVQRIYNLDDMVGSAYDAIKPLGSVKITMQKFYRVSGGSTQLRGVTPDIIVPDLYAKIKYGEKEEDFVMPWDEIAPAHYGKVHTGDYFDKVITESKKRIEANPTFKTIDAQSAEYKIQSENSAVTLNLKSYQNRLSESKKQEKEIEELKKSISPLSVYNCKSDSINLVGADSSKVRRNKEWMSSLSKDFYLGEVKNIITSMQKLK